MTAPAVLLAFGMEIYIKRGEEQFGPFTTEQVEESLRNGSLIESDIAWHAALPDWVPGTEVLASASHARAEAKRVGFPVILKAAGGGGGDRGQVT